MQIFPLLACTLSLATPAYLQSAVCEPAFSAEYIIPLSEGSTGVALGGGYRIVTGLVDPPTGQPTSTVYVFDTQGTLLHEFRLPDGVQATDLAIDGMYVAVGAIGDDAQGEDTGAVYVYSLNQGILIQTIFSPTPQVEGEFGFAVAMDEGLLLVGAPRESSQGVMSSGAVHAFQVDTGQWQATWSPSDPAPLAFFGRSLALDSGLAAVGAPLFSNAENSGSVYVFDANTGQQLAKYVEPGLEGGDAFGQSVDLDSEGLLVGSQEDGPFPLTNSGAIYLYDLATGLRLHKLLQSDASAGDLFGIDVALEGELIIGGCPGDNIHGPDSGSVYLFERASGQQLTKLFPPQGAAQDRIGFSLSMSGGRILVGTAGFVGADEDSGLGLEFTALLGTVVPYCTGATCPCGNSDSSAGCQNSTGQGARLSACGSTQISTDDLTLQGSSLPTSQFALLFMGNQIFELPFGDGLRCTGGDTLRFNPPTTIQADGTAVWGPGFVVTSCTQFPVTGCILPGATWNFQGWYRDPAGPCGAGFNTTDALAVTFEL